MSELDNDKIPGLRRFRVRQYELRALLQSFGTREVRLRSTSRSRTIRHLLGTRWVG